MPAIKCTRKQNATWAATRTCISLRRECGSVPPFSIVSGWTPEARNAGANPNRKVVSTTSAAPKPNTRQSAGRLNRAGLSAVPIMPTTKGAAHAANKPPRAVASSAICALSTITNCTSRHRPAPMETRNAISRARAAACAVIKLATFAHAMSSTKAISNPRISSARR